MFLFAVSIEAHGPYNTDDGLDLAKRKAMPVPTNMPADMVAPWQRYLLHIHHADAQLGRLIQALKHRNRPTLVLFYGDHLPGLNAAFRATGFKNGFPMLQQAGTWLLIDPKSPSPEPQRDVAAWMLPGMLLHRAGIDDSPYFRLVRKLGPRLVYQTRAIGAAVAPPQTSEMRRIDTEMRNATFIRLHQNGEIFDVPAVPFRRCTIADAQRVATFGMSKPLTSADVKVEMQLEGAPVLSVDGKSVKLTVDLLNQGSATLDSSGKYPVNLGVHLLDAAGHNVSNDFARAALDHPLLPGDSETVSFSVPATSLAGHGVAILPVQEKVAWFDKWGVAPLDVGPFRSCTGRPGKLCDHNGKPLAIAH